MKKLNKTCKFCKGKMEHLEERFECECGAMISIHDDVENLDSWTLPFDMNNEYA